MLLQAPSKQMVMPELLAVACKVESPRFVCPVWDPHLVRGALGGPLHPCPSSGLEPTTAVLCVSASFLASARGAELKTPQKPLIPVTVAGSKASNPTPKLPESCKAMKEICWLCVLPNGPTTGHRTMFVTCTGMVAGARTMGSRAASQPPPC